MNARDTPLGDLARAVVLVTLIALAVLLTGCGGGGSDADGKPDQTIDPPDCKAHPEQCK